MAKSLTPFEICKIDNEKSEAVFDLGENIKGTLHKSHLSDHEEHCNNLFERLSVNDILEDLIVIDVRKTFQRNSTFGWQIVFSKKPSFLEAKGEGFITLIGRGFNRRASILWLHSQHYSIWNFCSLPWQGNSIRSKVEYF